MPTPYATIIRQVVAQLNNIAGETASTMASAYAVAPLTVTELRTPYWSIPEIQDAVLGIQGDLIYAITNTVNQPFRAAFASRTAPLDSGAAIPSVDYNSKPIVGVLGNIRDWNVAGAAATHRCEEKDIPSIRRILTSGAYVANRYYYAATDGTTIYHTRSKVIIECCAYDRAPEVARVAHASNTMLLPDVLEGALVCGSVWRLSNKQGVYADAAAPLAAYYNAVQAQLMQGISAIQGFTSPTKTA
jgi:hypothetical protein